MKFTPFTKKTQKNVAFVVDWRFLFVVFLDIVTFLEVLWILLLSFFFVWKTSFVFLLLMKHPLKLFLVIFFGIDCYSLCWFIDGSDALRAGIELGYHAGIQRRNRDITHWVKKKRRMIKVTMVFNLMGLLNYERMITVWKFLKIWRGRFERR